MERLRSPKASILFFLLALLFFVNFNSSRIESISLLFSFFLLLFSIFCLLFFLISLYTRQLVIEKSIFYLVLIFFVYALVLFVMSFKGSNVEGGLRRSIQVLSVCFVIYTFYTIGTRCQVSNAIKHVLFVVILVSFIYLFASMYGLNFIKFSGGLNNPNGFGMWMAIWGLLVVSRSNRFKLILTVVFLFLIYISGSRTSLIAFLIGCFIVYAPLGFLRLTAVKYGLLVLVFISSLLIVYLTVSVDLGLYDSSVTSIAGKTLKSGRHLVWPAVLDAVWPERWFGLGTGANLSDFLDRTYSVHNGYLQAFMQTGFVGLFVMIVIFLKVYFMIFKCLDHDLFKTTLSMYMCLLLIQNFEVTAFQNNLSLSYPFWAFFGLLLSNRQRFKVS